MKSMGSTNQPNDTGPTNKRSQLSNCNQSINRLIIQANNQSIFMLLDPYFEGPEACSPDVHRIPSVSAAFAAVASTWSSSRPADPAVEDNRRNSADREDKRAFLDNKFHFSSTKKSTNTAIFIIKFQKDEERLFFLKTKRNKTKKKSKNDSNFYRTKSKWLQNPFSPLFLELLGTHIKVIHCGHALIDWLIDRLDRYKFFLFLIFWQWKLRSLKMDPGICIKHTSRRPGVRVILRRRHGVGLLLRWRLLLLLLLLLLRRRMHRVLLWTLRRWKSLLLRHGWNFALAGDKSAGPVAWNNHWTSVAVAAAAAVAGMATHWAIWAKIHRPRGCFVSGESKPVADALAAGAIHRMTARIPPVETAEDFPLSMQQKAIYVNGVYWLMGFIHPW